MRTGNQQNLAEYKVIQLNIIILKSKEYITQSKEINLVYRHIELK